MYFCFKATEQGLFKEVGVVFGEGVTDAGLYV